jgi:hypothetical protein
MLWRRRDVVHRQAEALILLVFQIARFLIA